jgi:hypothetical protein
MNTSTDAIGSVLGPHAATDTCWCSYVVHMTYRRWDVRYKVVPVLN